MERSSLSYLPLSNSFMFFGGTVVRAYTFAWKS